MKFLFLLPITVAAFAPAMQRPAFTSTSLFNGRVDSSIAIQAALEASKKFGPTSTEAKMAWETVEEMDSSDNRYIEERCMRPCERFLSVYLTHAISPCDHVLFVV
jgi:hypothetical protein